MTFIAFAPEPPVRGVTEETCLGEEDGSGHTAGLEGLIKGSELPGGGPLGLRQGLPFRVLAEEGVDVFNINTNEIKMKVSTRGRETNGKRTGTKTHKAGNGLRQGSPPVWIMYPWQPSPARTGGDVRPHGLGQRYAMTPIYAVHYRTHM